MNKKQTNKQKQNKTQQNKTKQKQNNHKTTTTTNKAKQNIQIKNGCGSHKLCLLADVCFISC